MGDEVAIELEWTGTLAVPAMNLAAGAQMKAFVAMFLTTIAIRQSSRSVEWKTSCEASLW
jgi:hypothetical protein